MSDRHRDEAGRPAPPLVSRPVSEDGELRLGVVGVSAEGARGVAPGPGGGAPRSGERARLGVSGAAKPRAKDDGPGVSNTRCTEPVGPTFPEETPLSPLLSGLVADPWGTEPPGPPGERPGALPSLLQCRVDALVIAFKVDVNEATLAEHQGKWALANDAKAGIALDLGSGLVVEMRAGSAPARWSFRTDDFRGVWDAKGSHGWRLEVVVSQVYLATHSLDEAIALTVRVAEAFGEVREVRMRRFDIAADFRNWTFEEGDDKALLTCRLTKRNRFAEVDAGELPELLDEQRAGDENRRTYRTKTGYRITGISISPNGDIHGRLYDKLEELGLPNRERKRAIELEAYRRAGWLEGETVARLEFQLRGKVLKEFNLRDPFKVAESLDKMWAYLTRRWCRLVELDTATRASRCRIDPRWEVVQAVVFQHKAAPAERKRERRGGATVAQTLGCMLSLLGGEGKLPDVSTIDRDENGRKVSAKRLIQRAEDMIWTLSRQLGETVLDELFGRAESHSTPHKMAQLFLGKVGGARARFASLDDDPDEPLQAVG